MTNAEIIEGLRGFARSMSLATDDLAVGFDAEDAVIIEAAIALIEPEPVTEDGLRELGLTCHGFRRAVVWKRKFGENGKLAVRLTNGSVEAVFCTVYGPVVFHIPHMQRLREVIAALEGESDADAD